MLSPLPTLIPYSYRKKVKKVKRSQFLFTELIKETFQSSTVIDNVDIDGSTVPKISIKKGNFYVFTL